MAFIGTISEHEAIGKVAEIYETVRNLALDHHTAGLGAAETAIMDFAAGDRSPPPERAP